MTPLHGIASRHDLPLDFEAVLIGAAAALLITFWVAVFAWRTPRYREPEGTALPRLTRVIDSPWVTVPLRTGVACVWLSAGVALLFGVDRIDNPVFGFVFVLLWVGVVPVSLLAGRVYRRTNPLRLTSHAPAGHPQSLLPAATALCGFSYLELVQPGGATLSVLRWFAAAWLAWAAVGTLVRGPRWISEADPFEAYADTLARLSPWARTYDGMIMWTSPLRNLACWRAPRHLALLAAVALGGTLFDAASNTALWVRMQQDLDGWAAWVVGIAGLLCCIAMVHGLFWLGTRPYEGPTMDDLAPGLVPLVAGYALAHYGTLLYLEGQRTIIRFSDPIGRGWDLLGIGGLSPETTLFSLPELIALTQVTLIVGGHVLGVIVTHDIALRSPMPHNTPQPQGSRDSSPLFSGVARHVPLLGSMVVFTVGGLILMFGG